jgi:hypothetical protein
MIRSSRMVKIVILSSFLLAFGAGCSSFKEASTASAKATPVPPVEAKAKPPVDYSKIEGAAKRAESAAVLAEAAAKKAEMASQKAEVSADKAAKAADKAEAMANKAEMIFKKKLKK